MTIEQRVAVLEEIFSKLRDYYMSDYSGEEIDALLASAGVPIGIIKEYDSVSAMNDDFSSTDVTRGQFVLILPTDTSSEDYGKVYLKGSANWVYVFTLTSLTAIKGPQGPAGKRGAKGADGADGKNFMVLGYYETLSALNAAVPSPGTGDTYGVGTEPPYAFYMYDPTISNWRYVGNLQGPEGPVGGSSNFVRYDAAQSLTDAQKQQARGNIAAANRETQDKVQAVSVPGRTVEIELSALQSYLDSLPRLLTEDLTINVTGSWTGNITVYGFYGSGRLTISGKDGCTLTGNMTINRCSVIMQLFDMAFQAPATGLHQNSLLYAVVNRHLWMQNCSFVGNGACAGVEGYISSKVCLVDSPISNCNIAVESVANGRMAVFNNSAVTYANNTYGASVYRGGIILLGENTPDTLGAATNIHVGGIIAKANGTLI